jgi:hypothetical protein
MDKDLHRIMELVVEIRRNWEHAVEGGVYSPRTETNGRGKGFHDSDPTHSAVDRPTQRQLRDAAREALVVTEEAVERLDLAAEILARAIRRSDPVEYQEFLEKRLAATQRA